MTCTIEGCELKRLARGWCARHWERWRRHGDPLGGRTDVGAPMAFLLNAVATCGDECIEWPFYVNPGGYGQITADGAPRLAHRLALSLHTGKPYDNDLDAAHAPLVCHNPPCINPRHLEWKTRAENMSDAITDKSLLRGERNNNAKLTADDVRAIRSDTRLHADIAADYSVQRRQISRIKRGERWGHIE